MYANERSTISEAQDTTTTGHHIGRTLAWNLSDSAGSDDNSFGPAFTIVIFLVGKAECNKERVNHTR